MEWQPVFVIGFGINPQFDMAACYEFRRGEFGRPFRARAADFSPYYNFAGGLQFRSPPLADAVEGV